MFFLLSLCFFVLKCKNPKKTCVFWFLVIFSNHKPSKKQKNTSFFLVFAFQNKKQKNTRITKKTSFEAKPKSLFKVLFFFLVLRFCGYCHSLHITSFQKSCNFYRNSFQERDHSKQYDCKLQEF